LPMEIYSINDIDTMFKGLDDRIKKLEAAPVTPPPTPTPVPPTPSTNVYDPFPTTYDIKTGNTQSPDKKWLLVYTGHNPDNHAITGQAGVTVPDKLPPDNSPRVYYAQPYAYGYTGTGTNANLSLTQAKFKNFDLNFYMRTVKSLKTSPKNWETCWLLLRFYDHFHHYFFDIQRNGTVEFGRKDNNSQMEEQTFLTTSGKVTYADGKWFKIRLKAEGNHFTNWIDDVLKFDIVDDGKIGTRKKAGNITLQVEPPSQPMYDGQIGNYVEDALGNWSPMNIIPLP
jgi:Domain of Unknown Function (DUF1080)